MENNWIKELSELQKANFWSKCKWSMYCWEWQANLNNKGYGTCKINGKLTSAHRVSYQIAYGLLPEKIHVLHKCDNPKCINPYHLFSGTHQDNMDDKKLKGRAKRPGKTSKYFGVYRRADSGKWRTAYCKNNKMVWLGCFNTEIEAAKYRDLKVIELKLKEPLNFPNKAIKSPIPNKPGRPYKTTTPNQ